jgi:hypothetical protein
MSRKLLAVLGVLAGVALVYRRAMTGYFFEDDFQWLAGTLTYDPSSVLSLAGRTHFYRPIIELYFWAATPLFDGSPALFHLANVVLHAANGLLLFEIARQIGRSDRYGFSAALFFVVMPGYVEAVAWVGALAEPIAAFFGCSSLCALLAYRRTGRRRAWQALSVAGFLLALLTHESSAVFLPILMLGDWAADPARPLIPRTRAEWREVATVYGPHVIAFGLYLVPDLWINQQSYIVAEGHYRLGFHIVPNALDYVVSLYVGKKILASYVVIVLALGWIAFRGNKRSRFAIGWMLLAMMPFVPFTWGNASRYLYLPAMGFAMLLAEGIEWLGSAMGRRGSRTERMEGTASPAWRSVVVSLLIAGVAIRYSVFASEGVSNFAARTEAYRRYARQVREAHPQLAPYSVVFIDPRDEEVLKHRYLEALVRWEYRDPTIKVVTREH